MAMTVAGSTITSNVAPMTPPNSKCCSSECLLRLIINWTHRRQRYNIWEFLDCQTVCIQSVSHNLHFM